MNAEASKERLSPELFEALSKSMNSDEPMKELMTKTLNLMIEAEFEVKIGAAPHAANPLCEYGGAAAYALRAYGLKYILISYKIHSSLPTLTSHII